MMKLLNISTIKALSIFALAGLPLFASAQEEQNSDTTSTAEQPATTPGKRVNLHFQTTYIYQYQPAFSAQYSGPNSLKSAEDKENSITATLYLGIRLWKGAEIYVNPELAGGSGLSGAFGLAASTNGETFRVGDPAPTLYLGRAYFSQTLALDKKKTDVPEGANEIGGSKPDNYIKFYLGKLSLGDLFDTNPYAGSPRTQFMNWCLMNNGAWDYAANTRGYTYSFATVLQYGSMTYKAALAMLPNVANGPDLNTNLGQESSVNAEIDKAYSLGLYKRKGNVRLMGYLNTGDMGSYAQAQQHPDTNGIPDVIATRKLGRTKAGLGINADQQLSDNLGIFVRGGWSDGKNETWCYTEADHTVSAGVAINGAAWKRKDDNLSLGVAVNGLSQDHREYLAAGGLGFQLGDGKLSYANESALELYYSYKPFAHNIWLTGDYQFIVNPGYNSDRGPVSVFSFRVHVEL